ncbi:hypothetical protein [Vulcanisaeta distributa]|uniref:hypothetical protein n=1 Tax=Vulcanisaeta distributa TaxID=164451 RepID=UPI001FB342B6|nr:hypothetical protein [Vulcanisaeta distributa]
MGFRSRLLVMALSVVVALALAFALALHIVNKPGGVKTTNPVGQASLATVNEPTPVSINTPIYVVGSSMLVQRLTSVGINQSLIKPITINELPSLPNNSLVIIDWSVIGPGLIINGGVVWFT